MDDVVELPLDPHPELPNAAGLAESERWLAEWESDWVDEPALDPDRDWSVGPDPESAADFDADFSSASDDAVDPASASTGPLGPGLLRPPVRRIVSTTTLIGFTIDEAAMAQLDGNRAMASQLAALAEVLDLARQHPEVYLSEAGLAERDAIELAERAAAVDAALQLRLTANQVRSRAYEGQVLADSLPQLAAAFRDGSIGYAQARAAVELVSGLTDPAAISQFDSDLAATAAQLTPGAFRQKARSLKERLLAEPAAHRHARAFAERRVLIEPAPDGMAWLHAYLGAPDAIRIKARLDATAKRIAKTQAHTARQAADAARAALDPTATLTGATASLTAAPFGPAADGRQTRDQIRADLLTGWLAGDGTPTAAKVRPLLFIPLLGLLAGPDPVGDSAPARAVLQARTADRAETARPTGQARPPDPPGLPAQPEPSEPPDPSNASNPSDPSDPSDPSEPSDPSGASDPSERPGQFQPPDRSSGRIPPAVLNGYGPIDPVTAAQLFRDAPAFRRVATDPFTGEILNFDRRRYRPTTAQRELLATIYRTCACAGCEQLAVDADLDHLQEWARDHGLTNIDNLIPLCARHHRLKTLSRIRFRRDRIGRVTVSTPTGFQARTRPRSPLGDTPPF